MKRVLFAILILLGGAALGHAQNQTTVTATITDPRGSPYQFGTGFATLVCPGNAQPSIRGAPVQRTITISGLDGFGTFTQRFYDINGLDQTGCGYRFAITDQSTAISFTTAVLTTVTGTSVNLSAQISSYSVLLPNNAGNASIKPVLPYNPLQYVSANGNDANDGLSWGSSKATVYGALLALPGGGTRFSGSGTVFVGPNSSANPTAGAGIWVMGPTDPNYASPPAGWLKCNACAVNVIGVGTTAPGYAWKPIFVPMTAGSTADRNHPSVWLSNLNQNFNVSNISFSGSQRPIVVGECSDNNRSNCIAFGGLFDGVDVNVTIVDASSGPGIDLANTTNMEIKNGSCTGSTSATVTWTADNAACILQVRGGLRVTNEELFRGGIKVTGLGASPGQFGTYLSYVDEYGDGGVTTQPPTVWFTNFTAISDAVLQNVTQQFGSVAVGAIRTDGTSTAGAGPIVIGGAGTVVVGSATILTNTPYYYSQASNKAIFNRQAGFINRYILGETDVARRISGLVPVRFANKADTNSANWTSAGNTITLAQTDPFGGTGAAKFHTTSVSSSAIFGSTTAYTPTINDWIVGGLWIKGSGVSGGYGQVGLTSPGVTFSTQVIQSGLDASDGNEWAWHYIAYKVSANAGATTLQLIQSISNAFDSIIYGPSLYILPAASVSDDEALWFANSAGSIDSTCTVGSICGVAGHPLHLADGTLTVPTGGLPVTLKLLGGVPSSGSQGGNINITGGNGVSSGGGVVNINAGNGVGTNQPGGNAYLTAGNSTGNAVGSVVQVRAGDGGATGIGGNVVLTPGVGSGGAVNGIVSITAGVFYFYPSSITFAFLGTPANGGLIYCSDCTIANPCAGGGTGALAKRLAGVWVCN